MNNYGVIVNEIGLEGSIRWVYQVSSCYASSAV
jgi:hypothetical protein